ncbi:MAG: TadE/TadG family type IV pilus assembly protein [Rudaea sp.]
MKNSSKSEADKVRTRLLRSARKHSPLPAGARSPKTLSPHFAASLQRGQSLVEVALLAPLLVLILLGALDLGRVYDAYVTITNASREGARYGAANPTCYVQTNCPALPTIQSKTVQETVNSGIALVPANVSVDCAPYGSSTFSQAYCAAPQLGDQIRVTVSYNFTFVTTQIVSAGNFTMSNYTVMAVTNGVCPAGQTC